MKHYGPMERPWALFDVNNMLWKMVSWLTLKRIMTPAFLTCYWQKSAQRVFLSGSFLFFIKLVIQGKEKSQKDGSMEWVFLSITS